MAFNQLKKWVGTQLWSTFMTEYNENVDELNRVIDGVNGNEANISLVEQNVADIIDQSSFIKLASGILYTGNPSATIKIPEGRYILITSREIANEPPVIAFFAVVNGNIYTYHEILSTSYITVTQNNDNLTVSIGIGTARYYIYSIN